jgi:hypothetical protein
LQLLFQLGNACRTRLQLKLQLLGARSGLLARALGVVAQAQRIRQAALGLSPS